MFFFGFEKTLKNVKTVGPTYSFRGHLITPFFNTQLPKVSTGKSPTSNIFAQKFGGIVFTFTKKVRNLELCVINVRKVVKCTRLTNK